jgi:hypothetical protein
LQRYAPALPPIVTVSYCAPTPYPTGVKFVSTNLDDFSKVQTNKGFDALWAPEPKLQVQHPCTLGAAAAPQLLQFLHDFPFSHSSSSHHPVDQAAHLSPSGYVLAEPYYAAYVRAMSDHFTSGASFTTAIHLFDFNSRHASPCRRPRCRRSYPEGQAAALLNRCIH